DIEERLSIPARTARPVDHTQLTALLTKFAGDSAWDVPDDDAVHALATDPISRKILEGGFLYPCQAMFSDARTPELFHAVDSPGDTGRPFLMVKGRGVLVRRVMTAAEIAMLSGLAQVVQRI